jgi:hypothetical protein
VPSRLARGPGCSPHAARPAPCRAERRAGPSPAGLRRTAPPYWPPASSQWTRRHSTGALLAPFILFGRFSACAAGERPGEGAHAVGPRAAPARGSGNCMTLPSGSAPSQRRKSRRAVAGSTWPPGLTAAGRRSSMPGTPNARRHVPGLFLLPAALSPAPACPVDGHPVTGSGRPGTLPGEDLPGGPGENATLHNVHYRLSGGVPGRGMVAAPLFICHGRSMGFFCAALCSRWRHR